MYTQEGISQIDYVANEGEVVTRGSDVCTVYTSGFNTREWTTLNNYRTQIKEYQKTLLAETNVEADSRARSASIPACWSARRKRNRWCRAKAAT